MSDNMERPLDIMHNQMIRMQIDKDGQFLEKVKNTKCLKKVEIKLTNPLKCSASNSVITYRGHNFNRVPRRKKGRYGKDKGK